MAGKAWVRQVRLRHHRPKSWRLADFRWLSVVEQLAAERGMGQKDTPLWGITPGVCLKRESRLHLGPGCVTQGKFCSASLELFCLLENARTQSLYHIPFQLSQTQWGTQNGLHGTVMLTMFPKNFFLCWGKSDKLFLWPLCPSWTTQKCDTKTLFPLISLGENTIFRIRFFSHLKQHQPREIPLKLTALLLM